MSRSGEVKGMGMGCCWGGGMVGYIYMRLCLRANNSSAPADVGSRVSCVHRRTSVDRQTIGAAAPWGGGRGVGREEQRHGQKKKERER